MFSNGFVIIFKISILMSNPHCTFILAIMTLNKESDLRILSVFIYFLILGLHLLKEEAFLWVFE